MEFTKLVGEVSSQLALIALIAFPTASFAEPVTLISNNGPGSNRVDMVFLGDGYTASEMAKYATDVQAVVTHYFSYAPFQDYVSYYNIRRIDVVSNESGADHPELGTFKDTAFDGTYNCANIQRLICVSSNEVFQVVNRNLAPTEADIVVVIVNDPEYGGSGGAVAVASTHSQSGDLVVHEVGHSFGLLADEYDYGSSNCSNPIEPSELNVTTETNRNNLKWNVGGGPPPGWVEFSTPIPITDTVAGQPGLYEGAKYCSENIYRPTYDSMMRSLDRPFDAVNVELLIRRIYNYVTPLESSLPVSTSLSLSRGTQQNFSVTTGNNASESVGVTWFLDSLVDGSGLNYDLNTSSLNLGPHTVLVSVEDATTNVRNDPYGVLSEVKQWNIEIIAAENDSDSDGVADTSDLCGDTAASLAVDANGCADEQVDSDDDGYCNPDAPGSGPSVCSGSDDFPSNPAEWNDNDNDGTGDNADPDDDNDKIADGIDTQPLTANNDCTSGTADDATFAEVVIDDKVCAARLSIDVISPAAVRQPGQLLLIAPSISFRSGFSASSLRAISAEPCPSC